MKTGGKILSIETSCDESSIAIIEKIAAFEYKVLSHQTISQINIHAQYGGVFPMLARREHELNLVPILEKVLSESDLLSPSSVTDAEGGQGPEGVKKLESILDRHEPLKIKLLDFLNKYDIEILKKEIDCIAVTNGPGLPPALWVGVNFARALAVILDKKIYAINHMEGHIIGGIAKREGDIVNLEKINYPALSLLISGGHTEMILSNAPMQYEKIGETVDDAVGECYDKVARMLGLTYPGGPEISRLAKEGRAQNVQLDKKLPRPMLHSGDLNFSFSGLKTAVLYYIRDNPDFYKVAIATEFEEVVKDVFVKKLESAIFKYNIKTLVVGGGVAANDYLRESFVKLAEEVNIKLHISSKELSTDNALMIALTAAYYAENNIEPSSESIEIKADSGLSF